MTLRIEVVVRGILLWRPVSIYHIPQVALAYIVVLMALCKIILRELEYQRNKD